ncbi:MAG: hypothetical protein ACYC2H_00955 [Thermoplasmatota archaeon]
MAPRTASLLILLFVAVAPVASAHGDLAVNELETLAIRDFEGQEDSFVWEGWEIWDVYVGEGYSQAKGSDGVYFKVNFAGDGTSRPTGGQVWTLTFRFSVGGQAFERIISHDGAEVTTDFEELESQLADGNVFQVRAWVPVPDWVGQSVTDIVIVSAVDGEPRDTAPGGIHAPGTGTEIPVEGPGTPVFPPLGEGRIVDSIPLTGPGKFLNVSITTMPDGAFEFTITNPLQEQGQHVMLGPASTAAWSVTPNDWNSNLEPGKSATLRAMISPTAANGSLVEPLRLDLLTDIGGRQTYFAFVDAGQITLTEDPAAAHAGTFGEADQEAPAMSFAALAIVLALAVAFRSVAGRRR